MTIVPPALLSAIARIRAFFSASTFTPSTSATSIEGAPAPVRKRVDQRHPTLWTARSSDAHRKMWCGPVAVAAILGADVAAVRDVIKRHRHGKPVKGTSAIELQLAFRHFGHHMELAADLRTNPPTLATWERERMDLDAAYVVMITGHWVAVRGKWFCDTFTKGLPVRIKDAPWRRKRVRMVYRVTVAPS